jgi:hypothetical protein
MTIRDTIEEYRNEIQRGNLLPIRVGEMITELSSLMGNILDEIRKRELEYNKVLLKFLDEEKKANRAKILAEVSPEYDSRQIARNTKEVTEEMIRGLKYLARAQEEEFRQSGN